MHLKLVMQSDVIGILEISCIGLWMPGLKKMTQELEGAAVENISVMEDLGLIQSFEKDEKPAFMMNVGKRC
jgi:hypothetical protein